MAKGEIFSGLPKWAQGVVAVAATGAIIFVGYKVYQKIQEGKKLEGAKDELTKGDSELGTLIGSGRGPKLTPTQASQIANNLYQAMNDVTYNTFGLDVKLIYQNIAKLRNDADVLLVIKSFGKDRKIRRGLFTPDFQGTLPSAFSAILSTSQINAINQMLAKKGISYRF